MAEFEINGVEYVTLKMPAKTQLKLLVRLTPLLPAIQAVAKMTHKAKLDADAKAAASVAAGNSVATPDEPSAPPDEVFAIVIKSLKELDESDLDYILDTTLAVVRRSEKGQLSPVWSAQAGRAFDEEMFDFPTMMRCVVTVLQSEFARFFQKGTAVLN